MELKGFPRKFWVVIDPRKQVYDDPELEDILFSADMHRMELQFRGGLNADDIYGLYTSESQAKRAAEKLLGLISASQKTAWEITRIAKTLLSEK